MKYKVYESEPLNFSIPKEEYIYGTNDLIQIYERINRPASLKGVIDLISSPQAKVALQSGERISVFSARELLVPVDKEKVLASGIVPIVDSALIVDTIKLSISQNKNVLTKSEMMILDLIANYEWERPIYFVALGGDLGIGIREYLEFNGFAYKFVPIKVQNSMGNPGRVNALEMYNKVMNVYRWGNMNDPSVNIDYQNLLTFGAVVSVRNIHTQVAKALVQAGEREKAVEVLDRMQEVMIPSQFPLNASLLPSLNEYSVVECIDLYFLAGEKEKGMAIANEFIDETIKSINMFATQHRGRYLSKRDIESNLSFLFYVSDIFKNRGYSKESEELEANVNKLIESL